MPVSRPLSLAVGEGPCLGFSVAEIPFCLQCSSESSPSSSSFLLEQHGFSDIKVEDTTKGHIVLLQEAETLIQIEEDSTHIICDNDEMLRVRLRDLVLKFLQKF